MQHLKKILAIKFITFYQKEFDFQGNSSNKKFLFLLNKSWACFIYTDECACFNLDDHMTVLNDANAIRMKQAKDMFESKKYLN